jgi:isoleucyl-tRNA synthetase
MDMLVKAYFTFRNTSRFLLGNLFDFIPSEHSVPLENLGCPADRHAVRTLNKLIAGAAEAYAKYAFHDVYHAVMNFMGAMSAFYLDVLKDRLYTRFAGDPLRRGSQTVMLLILLDATRIMAPILSFTCEEIWGHLPEADKNPPSVFLSDFPRPHPEAGPPEEAQEMERLIQIRGAAYKSLEEARKNKVIGSSLDASVTLRAGSSDLALLKKYEGLLPELFIVSQTALEGGGPEDPESLPEALVGACAWPKCPRCWTRSPEVPPDQSAVCPKCQEALAQRAKAGA